MPNELSYEVSLERSNQIRADLPQHPEKYTMLTGDRPTGRLHLGHYFGTLKSRVELQELGVHTNVLIADYQVITDRDSTDNIQDNVYNMVIDYLACGLDPDKTMIYTHSAVPACNQLMLPFLSLVSEALLQRNPTVKAEMEASGHELTGLLLTYPVHQACDILFCKGNVVPVGRDQLPHIELTRTIARKFNNRYGNVFPVVDALLSDTPLLPGLDGRKMSKSYGNAINISMTAEETAKRIKKSQTDGERMITFDPEARPGVSGLLSTAAICTGRSEVEIAEEIGMGGSGQLKKYVTESVNEYFAPHPRPPRGTGPGYGLRQGRPARGQSPCQRGRRGDARRGARSHGNGVLGHPPRWHARRHSNGPPSRARAFDIARVLRGGDNKPASFFTLYGGLHVPTCCQRYG